MQTPSASSMFWAGMRELLADISNKNSTPSPRHIPLLESGLVNFFHLILQSKQRLWESRKAIFQAPRLTATVKNSLCSLEEWKPVFRAQDLLVVEYCCLFGTQLTENWGITRTKLKIWAKPIGTGAGPRKDVLSDLDVGCQKQSQEGIRFTAIQQEAGNKYQEW